MVMSSTTLKVRHSIAAVARWTKSCRGAASEAVEGGGAGAARSWTGRRRGHAPGDARHVGPPRRLQPRAARDPRRPLVAFAAASLPAPEPAPQTFYFHRARPWCTRTTFVACGGRVRAHLAAVTGTNFEKTESNTNPNEVVAIASGILNEGRKMYQRGMAKILIIYSGTLHGHGRNSSFQPFSSHTKTAEVPEPSSEYE